MLVNFASNLRSLYNMQLATNLKLRLLGFNNIIKVYKLYIATSIKYLSTHFEGFLRMLHICIFRDVGPIIFFF